jgi:hypothetical protein
MKNRAMRNFHVDTDHQRKPLTMLSMKPMRKEAGLPSPRLVPVVAEDFIAHRWNDEVSMTIYDSEVLKLKSAAA